MNKNVSLIFLFRDEFHNEILEIHTVFFISVDFVSQR